MGRQDFVKVDETDQKTNISVQYDSSADSGRWKIWIPNSYQGWTHFTEEQMAVILKLVKRVKGELDE
jgi:hypothetical protein